MGFDAYDRGPARPGSLADITNNAVAGAASIPVPPRNNGGDNAQALAMRLLDARLAVIDSRLQAVEGAITRLIEVNSMLVAVLTAALQPDPADAGPPAAEPAP